MNQQQRRLADSRDEFTFTPLADAAFLDSDVQLPRHSMPTEIQSLVQHCVPVESSSNIGSFEDTFIAPLDTSWPFKVRRVGNTCQYESNRRDR